MDAARLAIDVGTLLVDLQSSLPPAREDPLGHLECRTRAIALAMGILARVTLASDIESPRPGASLDELLTPLATLVGPASLLVDVAGAPTSVVTVLEQTATTLLRARMGPGVLSTTYENVMAEAGMALDVRHSQRDRRKDLGAFYTPEALARACTRRALREATRTLPAGEHESITTRSVVDWSCGTGRFLVAWLHAVEAAALTSGTTALQARAWMQHAARALHGVDVDPIALDIARLEIALAVDDPSLCERLGASFRLANPLLRCSGPSSQRERVRYALVGAHYEPALGVDEDSDRTFDVVVGNPPWHRIRLEERAFFRHWAPEVVDSTKKDERRRAIDRLAETAPALHALWTARVASLEQAQTSIRQDARFALTTVGELSAYALFAELALRTIDSRHGIAALLVKSGLLTTTVHRRFFRHLVGDSRLIEAWDFVNSQTIFEVDSRERFAFLMLGCPPDGRVRFAMGQTSIESLTDDAALRSMTAEELAILNPVTGMLPATSTHFDLELMARLTKSNVHFDDAYPEARFGRLLHLSVHADHIRRTPSEEHLPVTEGKFFEQYDGRFAGFGGVAEAARGAAKARARVLNEVEKADPCVVPEARFFVDRTFWSRLSRKYDQPWSLVWRNTTSASNRRTVIATILPFGPTTQSVQLLQLSNMRTLALLLATMNSTVFDWLTRSRLTGIDLTSTVVRQVAVPATSRWEEVVEFFGQRASLADHVLRRVSALLGDDARLRPFCSAFAVVPTVVGAQRRLFQREIDVLVAWAYGLEPTQAAIIHESFAAGLSAEERHWLSQPAHWPQAVRTLPTGAEVQG